MIIKLPTNAEFALRKLRMNGLTLDGAVDVEDSAVVLLNVLVEDCIISSPVVVNLTRNAVLVSLNPQIGEILGYQPACRSIMTAGDWGQVEATCQGVDEEQEARLTALPWFAKLHFVPVQGFS